MSQYVIVDGGSIGGRCFFATHKQPTTVFDEYAFTQAFAGSLLKALRTTVTEPSVVLICADSRCWRYDEWPSYKANRGTLKSSVPYESYKEYLHVLYAELQTYFPFHVIKRARYEADDLLAWYAKKLPSCILISGDKDVALLGEQAPQKNVRVYNPFTEAFQEMPALIGKQELICCGDASDGIPSIIPRDATGKLKRKLGSTAILKHYDPTAPCKMNEAFWATIDKDDVELVKQAYERNSRLIDLDRSPVHQEILPCPQFGAKSCNTEVARKLLRLYLGQRYDAQAQALDALISPRSAGGFLF